MNTLPDNILDKIYNYKHQLVYKNVMLDFIQLFAYCGWCGKWMIAEQTCRDCWDEDENTITLFKIHCSRCGGAIVMDLIPILSSLCHDCVDDSNDGDTHYEELTVPRRHHERHPHVR